jgi:hypothetical protein
MKLGSRDRARRRRLVAQAAACLIIIAPAVLAGPVVEVQSGNVVVQDRGKSRQITGSGRDADAVAAPDGQTIVYTRAAKRAGTDSDNPHCPMREADELRRVRLDGSGDELLVRGRVAQEPEQMLCDFSRKQFSSDGRYLYFLSRAWATSGALHVYDVQQKRESYLLPANDVVVLSACASKEHRDRLVVQQHRYFVVAGSFDWYWLYDRGGRKEIGPVGEYDNAAAVLTAFKDMGCEP